MSSECEVSEFLFALVRLLKPKLVIETGCYLGESSVMLGRALKLNHYGRLITCDSDPEFAAQVRAKITRLQLPVQVVHENSEELIERVGSVDLAFIDSGQRRPEEIAALAPKLTRFGLIALHDTAPHQFFVDDSYFRPLRLRSIYMNTPRGLTLFQRLPANRNRSVDGLGRNRGYKAVHLAKAGKEPRRF